MAKIPRNIGSYSILGLLGQGAASKIYKAKDPLDGKIYALKHIVKGDDDGRFIEQAEIEHNFASEMTHPGLRRSLKIIKIRKMLKLSELIVLMEYLDGETLEHRRPRTIGKLMRVIYDVAGGLHAMHQMGYVHCDIKPNNIIVTTDKQVKIIDYGQSCRAGTVKKRVQGTPDYIAPEQVMKLPLSPQTDVFNLGATIYWCLTNQFIPTMLSGNKGLNSASSGSFSPQRPPAPKPIHEINPSVPEQLSRMVEKCVAFEAQDRPEDMKAVQGLIKALAAVIR